MNLYFSPFPKLPQREQKNNWMSAETRLPITCCCCKNHRRYSLTNRFQVIWELTTFTRCHGALSTRSEKLLTTSDPSAATVHHFGFIINQFIGHAAAAVYIFLLFAVTHINKCFDWMGIGAIIRRQSLARLHSMAIEGPITKVINIITAAQESSPNYISQALDKVYIASL